MVTECTPDQLEFQGLGRRKIIADFEGGRITSDAGALLLREVDLRINLVDRLARCFTDYRSPLLTEHSVRDLVAQRVFGIALGYEDLNDHDELRRDQMLAALIGSRDMQGKRRTRERDRGCPLAGSNTLNRLELSDPTTASCHRYKKIAADRTAIDELLIDIFIESYKQPPKEIWLDVDATDDPLHGKQEGRFFHGYYDCYCYMPLYIFCGEHLLGARLRESNQDGAAGCLEELQSIVERIRQRWPTTRVVIRGDSGFCREPIMRWCEQNKRIDYLFGLAKNQRLIRALGAWIWEARQAHQRTGESARRFGELQYRTQKSWSTTRRVVGKAEMLSRGLNPRFVVTNIPQSRIRARRLYEKYYCIRGEMENRIKEQQLALFADRTSAATMRANQLRLYFASLAYVLMHGLRRLGLEGTPFERAQCGTIRVKLLKIGARLSVSVRRLVLSFSAVYPWQIAFRRIVSKLTAIPLWAPSG